IGAEGGASVDANINKFSVLLVQVKRAGGGVVGHVDFWPAVIVEVAGENAEAVRSVGLGDAGRIRDIGESAIAVVVEKDVLAAIQSRRAAGDHQSFIETGAGFRDGRGGQIHINVVGHEEIE